MAESESGQSSRPPLLRRTGVDSLNIERVRQGRGFVFRRQGRLLPRDNAAVQRAGHLAIPPAWTQVRISSLAGSHLQAIGYDVKGRRQYLYHPEWRLRRERQKYSRLALFARALPGIRRGVRRDLNKAGLVKTRVLAAVVRLLDLSSIRVGNEEYARTNGSYGLTTLRDSHVRISAGQIQFRFRGKSGKEQSMKIFEPSLARLVGRCQDLPGEQLFQYLDTAGKRQKIASTSVNEYLRQIANSDFTAKDFRTWTASVETAGTLASLKPFTTMAEGKRNICAAIEAAALRLGNTPTICRKSYVHPLIVRFYLQNPKKWLRRYQLGREKALRGLNQNEYALLHLLGHRLR